MAANEYISRPGEVLYSRMPCRPSPMHKASLGRGRSRCAASAFRRDCESRCGKQERTQQEKNILFGVGALRKTQTLRKRIVCSHSHSLDTAPIEFSRPSARGSPHRQSQRQRAPGVCGCQAQQTEERTDKPSAAQAFACMDADSSTSSVCMLQLNVPLVHMKKFNPFPATEIRRALRPCADRPSIGRASSVGCPRDLRALKPPCHTQDARC